MQSQKFRKTFLENENQLVLIGRSCLVTNYIQLVEHSSNIEL